MGCCCCCCVKVSFFHCTAVGETNSTTLALGMLKSFFFLIFDSRNQKFNFFIIVYQPTRETGSDRHQVRMTSLAVRRQRADVSLVVLSAPRPHYPLWLRLQQQCILPTATVWCIQALARRTVARGIMDQRLLCRRTGAHQLRRDKADIKRHPAAVCLIHSPSQITANY